MNYVEMYPGDYLRDTADLSLAEHGAYLLLLFHCYATEGPLPNDNPAVFRIARAMGEAEQAAVLRVLDRFFPVDPSDGLRHNERAEREIGKAIERIEKNRSNGKKGGRPKKPNQNPTVNPNETQRLTQTGTQTQTQTKAHHTPHAIEDQKQTTPPAAVDSKADLFARWKAVPNSGGGAFLNKLFRDHKPEQRVLEAIEQTLDHNPADVKAFVLGVLKRESALETAHNTLLAGVI